MINNVIYTKCFSIQQELNICLVKQNSHMNFVFFYSIPPLLDPTLPEGATFNICAKGSSTSSASPEVRTKNSLSHLTPKNSGRVKNNYRINKNKTMNNY